MSEAEYYYIRPSVITCPSPIAASKDLHPRMRRMQSRMSSYSVMVVMALRCGLCIFMRSSVYAAA